MKGLNWGLCSSPSWTDNDNRHALIAEESSHFGISCQTANFDDRYKNNIFFNRQIMLEGDWEGSTEINVVDENPVGLSVWNQKGTKSIFSTDFNASGKISNVFWHIRKYFLWTVASKHPISVNLVIRNCWTHEKEIQFSAICILSENNIFVPKSPSVSISILVYLVQLSYSVHG